MTIIYSDDARKWVIRITCGLVFVLAALLLGAGTPAGAAPQAQPQDTATPTATPTPPPVEACGPNANYTVTASTGVQLVPGTLDIGNHCYPCSTQIYLPFNFTLYGQEYNTAWATNTGNLQFGSNNLQYWIQCLPRSEFSTVIFADWDYLDTSRDNCANCGIFTSVSGQAPNRIFNIEWRALITYSNSPVNFEIRLYEDQSRFDLVYGQMDQSGSNAVVGVQRDTGSHYTQYECMSGGLVSGLQLTFTQPVCPTPTGTPPTPTITRTPTITPTPTAVCGPAANYQYVEATGTIVPATDDIGNHCNDCTTAVNLPFTYYFYGQPYNTAMASSNGTLQFASNNPTLLYDCLPYPAMSDTIFALWTDLTTQTDGYYGCAQCGIFTATSGVAPNRVFDIEWRANTEDVNPFYTNFEVRLYEGQSTFDIVYGAEEHPWVDFSVGVQEGTGEQYVRYACADGVLHDGLLVRYSQPDCSVTPSPTLTPSPTPTSVPIEACGVNANYNVYQTTGAIVPGTVDTGNHCEGCTTAITLPFTYDFYGQPFTTARVSSFGNLQFTSDVQNDFTTTCLPNSGYDNAIFVYWDHMHTVNTTGCDECGIFTSVSGTAPNRIFNIEWHTVQWNGVDRANFEIRLYESSGRFDLVYGQIDNGGAGATVGVQRDNGSHFTQYLCHPYAAVIDPNLMLVFEQPECEGSPTPTITPGGPTLTPSPTPTATPCGQGADYTIATATATLVPGTADIGNHCDDCLTTIQLPFSYSLYGQPFNSANVSANGTFQFNSNNTDWGNLCLPAPGFYNTVFAYWDDLRTDSVETATLPTGIFTSVTGIAPNRVFNVEWRACVRPDDGGSCLDTDTNFEVRLYEGQSRFDVVYGQVADGGSSATIGVQRGLFGGVNHHTQYACNTGGLTVSTALIFTVPCGPSGPAGPAGAPDPPDPGGAYAYIDGPGRVPAEALGVPFGLDLLVNSGTHSVIAAQNYLTFTTDLLRVVDPTARTCVDAPTLSADTTIFDRVLQNEVCNGPAPCTFRGNLVPPGSIAFASAAYMNPPASGYFHVARLMFCASGEGTVVLHWQFSPPAPPERDSAVLDFGDNLSSVHTLYADYVLDLGGSATPAPTSTTGAMPSATPVPSSTAGIGPSATPPGAGPSPTLALTATPVPPASATPSPVRTNTPGAIAFADVHPTDYFYSAVTDLAARRVISGYADGTFRPYNYTTRGQLAKIVVLARGWTTDTTGGPHFRDVAPGSAFYVYVETAYHRSILSGYACGAGCLEFRPGANVTRAQLAKILVAAAGWPLDTTGGPHFRDVPAADPFYTYVETGYHHGVLSGYTCGAGCLEFRPGNNATRGQIAKIVYGAMQQWLPP